MHLVRPVESGQSRDVAIDWMFLSSKTYMSTWFPMTVKWVFAGETNRRWLGHVGGDFVGGISFLIKRHSLASGSFCCARKRWEDSEPSLNQEAGSHQAPWSWSCRASRTVRTKCLLFKVASPWYFCDAGSNRLNPLTWVAHPFTGTRGYLLLIEIGQGKNTCIWKALLLYLCLLPSFQRP